MPSSKHDNKRVLHVVECLGAGVATAVFTYIDQVPEHEHHLLYSTRAETTTLPDGWEKRFATVQVLPEGHLGRIVAVRNLADRLTADVVHAHSSYAGVYVRLALRSRAGRRIVYTPHAYAFERRDLHDAGRAGFWCIEAVLALNTGTFAACSPREANLSRWALGRARVVHVPNFADLPVMPRGADTGKPMRDTEQPVRIAGSGRVGRQKDPVFMIEAVEAVRRAGHRVEAVWIGGGEQQLEMRLANAGIEVTGWIGRAEAIGMLSRQDVYVHTADWEGFPFAVLEATAVGTPIVVRSRPHFQGLGLPLEIETAAELVDCWHAIGSEERRELLVSQARVALAGHTGAAQAEALRGVYGGDAALDAVEARLASA